ncbi:unnamed protein product, partial [Ectocarpus sp. 4 AP-2014]
LKLHAGQEVGYCDSRHVAGTPQAYFRSRVVRILPEQEDQQNNASRIVLAGGAYLHGQWKLYRIAKDSNGVKRRDRRFNLAKHYKMVT